MKQHDERFRKKDEITGQISIYWYIGSIVTFLFYGIALDGIKMLFDNLKHDGEYIMED